MHFPPARKTAKRKGAAAVPDGKSPSARTLRAVARVYLSLLRQWGPQNWWPAESKFEVIVGAILTQNTSWTNVEKALRNLREAGMLSPETIRQADCSRLETLLRPAGYYRQKTRRLQDLTAFILANYGAGRTSAKGDEHPAIAHLFQQPTEKLRAILLEKKGVGPETADSILLYAGNYPVFVVDAYTRRVFERHQLVPPGADYETIGRLVERSLRNLPPERRADSAIAGESVRRPKIHDPSSISAASRPELAQRYNEFHALLVQVGKHYCLKKAPNCTDCPLSRFLPASDHARSTE